MKPDQFLRDVFAAQADSHANSEDVLASVHERLNRPHRTAGRAVIVAGAVAAVVAVAGSAVVLSDRTSEHHSATAPRGPAAASPALVTSAPPAHTTSARSCAGAAAPPTAGGPAQVRMKSQYPYSTIAAGWLPGAGEQVMATNQRGFEQRDYTVHVDGTAMDVIIYLEDGSSLPGRTEAGSNYRDIEINGHPAREFIADVVTIVAFNLGNGKIAYAGPSVVATTNQITSARISDIAVHVARDMQFNRHDSIPAC